jgi:signal recognition particle receptor subunit beta
MAKLSNDETAVNARILYWGFDGSGKTANLHSIHRKLRADHRGEIQREATLIDPAVEFETLAIELGEVGGLKTRIQMIAVPGGADQAPTRKQLLDQVDGIVLVIDSRRERIEENASSLVELREMLLEYGRDLEDVPLVLQYNKRDLSDPYALEELHRKLDVNGAAVFEAVATEDSGILQTLSTISKHVVRSLRGQQFSAEVEGEAKPEPGDSLSGLQVQSEPTQTAKIDPVAELTPAAPKPADATPALPKPAEATPALPKPAEATPAARMEDAILSEEEHSEANALDDLAAAAQTALDIPLNELEAESDPLAAAQLDSEFSIASVGEATRSGERGVCIPLVISDKDGRTSNLVLTIRLDPLLDGESD